MGRVSVAGTALLALGGFVLSFAALRDLAVRVGMPADLGWIWPLLIDGLIVEATLAVVSLARCGSRSVWYAWFLLSAGAVVSVGSNGAHAVVTGHGLAGAAAASVPPVVLLATTHLTVLLMAAPDASQARAAAPAAETTGVRPGSSDGSGDRTPPHDATETPTGAGAEKPDVTTAAASEAPPEPVDELSLEDWVNQQEAAGATVTGAMVAERLGVSASTGRRRLAALRKSGQPRLRLAGAE